MAALSLAQPALLILFAAIVCFSSNADGNVLRLFSNNPPDFVNIEDLKSTIQSIVDKIGNRLRCDDHGLEISECVKCLDTDYLIRILKLDPMSKSISRQNAEELAILLAHQILYFESMCVSQSPGCTDYKDCEDEVLEVMGRYTSLRESLVKILRIFKMYLKEQDGKKCLNSDQIVSQLPISSSGVNVVKENRKMYAVVMGYLLEGYCIDAGESVTDFIDDIFHHYGASCSPYMTIDGLKKIMRDLKNGQSSEHDHDHQHSDHHDNDNEHDHNHNCEHKHGEYTHYHSHSDHAHGEPHHDIHFYHDHNDIHPHHDHDDIHSHHDHDDIHSHHDHDDTHSHQDHNDTRNYVTHPYYHHDFNNSHDQIHPDGHKNSDLDNDHNKNTTSMETGLVPLLTEIPTLNEAVVELSTVSSDGIVNRTDQSNLYLKNMTVEISTTDSTTTTVKVQETTVENSTDVGLHRIRRFLKTKRSAEEDIDKFNQPARSLRSDFSLPEDRHHIEMNRHHEDDVKKVYLLENEENNNRNVELSGTPHQFASLASKCLSIEELMEKFGHTSNGSLSKEDFIEICPALVHQIVSGVCTNPVLPPPLVPSKMEVYGYSSIAVLIISLGSLIGVLLLPFMGKQVYSYIISGFCGLAFSTLTADALLHLIPQFLGLHTHGPGEDHGHSHEDVVFEPYVQLQLGVFVTIYALFLFESIMSAFSGSDNHSSESKGHGHSHSHLPDGLPTLMSVKTKSETQLAVSRDQSNSSLNTEIIEVEAIKKPPNLMVNKPIFLGLTSFAIVVTIGDSVHNFGDGLAIGAAFSTGIRGGLSTAIAVLFHELPHEFGDFVILLSTGLSFSKALWINFLSSLTCFAGLYIGILIGDNEDARKWVMVITAGTFLYVALGEMLPDLREHHTGSRIKMLLVKNLGILSGIALMFLISIYESKIV